MSDETKDWAIEVTGREAHWQNLDELAVDEASRDRLKSAILDRFPTHFLSRREFMEWSSGLIGVLGLSACTRQPREKILPYSKMPENLVPGKPLFFATSFCGSGGAEGVLVESHMGRPTKIEGNPEHPASLGGTSAWAQASILELYDPDRIQVPRFRGITATWENFEENFQKALVSAGEKGNGLCILAENVSSPTLASQLAALLKQFPGAKWATYEPFDSGNAQAGAKLAFGVEVDTHFDLTKADVIVSLDSDFMNQGPAAVRYARDFASRRRAGTPVSSFNRLYAFESTPTVSGSLADHRFPGTPTDIAYVALALAARLGVSVPKVGGLKPEQMKRVEIVAEDLLAHRGTSVVIAGEFQSPEVHAIAGAINAVLGNLGKAVFLAEPVNAKGNTTYRALVEEMAAGKVGVLMVLGGNPSLTSPRSINFTKALENVAFTVHHTLLSNETSQICQWQVPATHYLEHWSDARAYDGTASIVQPLIAPLYAGRSSHQLISMVTGRKQSGYEIVREYWRGKLTKFEEQWNRAIHDGVVKGTTSATRTVSARSLQGITIPAARGMAVTLRPDPTIGDGRFANNAWLQELPKPMTKLTWENAFFLAPETAKRLAVVSGEKVKVTVDNVSVEGPVWVHPGQPEQCIGATVGYGRKAAGRVGSEHGFDAYLLFGDANEWDLSGAEIEKIPGKVQLATTQHHFTMDGRDIVRSATVKQFEEKPDVFKSRHKHQPEPQRPPGVGKPFEDPTYAWGMALDLSVCNGCSACVVACQSENNIPVVGKEEVLRGREMHWLRIDRYYQGAPENPVTHSMPVPCMHCETAPCEVVCPVNATTHSPEGINEMTYNRCVGTKYCSNNCPYKVRRFNFYKYSDMETPSLQLGRNPDVTTRGRGVMEKCTYCVQRVNHARIEAKKENRTLKDGEFTTACASACPTNAIVFGNVKDPGSAVSKAKARPQNYGLLEELGTLPRTTYLARLRNPNPKLETGGHDSGSH